MKKIILTQNRFALVDDEDFERLSAFKWNCFYAKNSNSYYAKRKEKNTGKTIYMHREIMQPEKGLQVDHIDHDTLNNQRKNLRIVSNLENSKNRKINSNNTSGYLGVMKKGSKWQSSIYIDGKNMYLGRFINLSDAVNARKLAEINLGFHKNHGININEVENG